jgi:hypothetical protein
MNTLASGLCDTQGGGHSHDVPCHGARIPQHVTIEMEGSLMSCIATSASQDDTGRITQSAMRLKISKSVLKKGLSNLICHYRILKRGARKLAMQIQRESRA